MKSFERAFLLSGNVRGAPKAAPAWAPGHCPQATCRTGTPTHFSIRDQMTLAMRIRLWFSDGGICMGRRFVRGISIFWAAYFSFTACGPAAAVFEPPEETAPFHAFSGTQRFTIASRFVTRKRSAEHFRLSTLTLKKCKQKRGDASPLFNVGLKAPRYTQQ